MQRNVVLYPATVIVLIPIDFLFLGIVAKGFFTSEVGGMLPKSGWRPPSCSICFTSWELDFCQRFGNRHWQSTRLFGALFGLLC